MNEIIFVSSPYSHENEEIVKERYEKVAKYVAKMVTEGYVVFSPIIYGHTLCQYEEIPGDFDFWENFCLTFLSKSRKMIVLKLDGYSDSIGVENEIKFAKENKIPIAYVDYKE